jgi:cold-inducible RNA-binding protein
METFMNIYAGNLSRELTEDELKEAFAAYGAVDSAKIITDKFTGISRGFGFVEMPDESEAQNAIGELNGKDLKGRTIIVNKARPRTDRSGGRSGGRGGFGGRGGGGFGNRRY